MIDEHLPDPAGFGNCDLCAYFATGPRQVCQRCAAATVQKAGPWSCGVCGQSLATEQARCGNNLCTDPERHFDFNRAIAMKTGPLERAIHSHKYDKVWGWGVIFSRVLLGYLETDPSVASADLIIPMPTLPLAPGARTRKAVDHSGWIVESAAAEDEYGRFPFRVDPPVIIKTTPTPKMASAASYAERRALSQTIYTALEVLEPCAVAGATVVVVDDVFTTGWTLDAVARRLRESGARGVLGVTIARQPWGSTAWPS